MVRCQGAIYQQAYVISDMDGRHASGSITEDGEELVSGSIYGTTDRRSQRMKKRRDIHRPMNVPCTTYHYEKLFDHRQYRPMTYDTEQLLTAPDARRSPASRSPSPAVSGRCRWPA